MAFFGLVCHVAKELIQKKNLSFFVFYPAGQINLKCKIPFGNISCSKSSS